MGASLMIVGSRQWAPNAAPFALLIIADAASAEHLGDAVDCIYLTRLDVLFDCPQVAVQNSFILESDLNWR